MVIIAQVCIPHLFVHGAGDDAAEEEKPGSGSGGTLIPRPKPSPFRRKVLRGLQAQLQLRNQHPELNA